ncbi:hypothetical protein PR048_031257 [Dryococelus australis]|uniref:Uncharacterized protein n=1 Tax=Dryococelus australis TaxID=614101 RepID=A0ABQ9G4R3_9NEOP|nr:hypothetical protein PR048_031257 [Dryococelus australis]
MIDVSEFRLALKSISHRRGGTRSTVHSINSGGSSYLALGPHSIIHKVRDVVLTASVFSGEALERPACLQYRSYKGMIHDKLGGEEGGSIPLCRSDGLGRHIRPLQSSETSSVRSTGDIKQNRHRGTSNTEVKYPLTPRTPSGTRQQYGATSRRNTEERTVPRLIMFLRLIYINEIELAERASLAVSNTPQYKYSAHQNLTRLQHFSSSAIAEVLAARHLVVRNVLGSSPGLRHKCNRKFVLLSPTGCCVTPDMPQHTLQERACCMEHYVRRYRTGRTGMNGDPSLASALNDAVVWWLDNSPPTNANRVPFLTGCPQDFRARGSCRTMPLVGGFPRGSLVSNTLAFRHCSYLVIRSTPPPPPVLALNCIFHLGNGHACLGNQNQWGGRGGGRGRSADFGTNPVSRRVRFAAESLPMPPDQRVFSGISHLSLPCISALLHTHLASPSSPLTSSMLRLAYGCRTQREEDKRHILKAYLVEAYKVVQCTVDSQMSSKRLKKCNHRMLENPDAEDIETVLLSASGVHLGFHSSLATVQETTSSAVYAALVQTVWNHHLESRLDQGVLEQGTSHRACVVPSEHPLAMRRHTAKHSREQYQVRSWEPLFRLIDEVVNSCSLVSLSAATFPASFTSIRAVILACGLRISVEDFIELLLCREVKCCEVSWCLLSAVHTRRKQQEPATIAGPGETGCTAATHERAARHPLHTCCDVS